MDAHLGMSSQLCVHMSADTQTHKRMYECTCAVVFMTKAVCWERIYVNVLKNIKALIPRCTVLIPKNLTCMRCSTILDQNCWVISPY